MKQILLFLVIATFIFAFTGCEEKKTSENNDLNSEYTDINEGNDDENNDTNITTSSNDTESSENTNSEKVSSKWYNAGKGCGKILPEPNEEYNLLQYSSFIAAELLNSTETNFHSYVERCKNAGFDGNIGTAESPDIYFNGKTSDGYSVQVFFYEAEQKINISAFPPS